MPKIQYETIALRGKAMETIDRANSIIEDYAAQGYSLTLRQLYYQFVSRNWCENTDRQYQRLSVVISNGRRAGLIDWEAIVDRTRFLRQKARWDDVPRFLASVASQYRRDFWDAQPHYIEVWFEKDALLGVFERAAVEFRLPLISCRGYGSDSTWWESAQRIRAIGKPTTILHFGDHDPSGLDMTRDVRERLALFGAEVEVKRLALNMDQVRKHRPPPNPAKEKDSRYADYVRQFGEKSWELDALSPDILVKMVNAEVKKHVDDELWAAAEVLEEREREALKKLSPKWPSVEKLLRRLKK